MKKTTFDDYYTEVTLKHKYPQEFGPHKFTISRKVWDLSASDFFLLLHDLFLLDGYQEASFLDLCREYVELHSSTNND